jgi:hypothetical protein
MFSASGVIQIYDNLGDKNKAHFAALPIPKMVDTAFKLINKFSSKGKLGSGGR